MDFGAIANTSFDDLLLLREEAGQRREALGKEAQAAIARCEHNPDLASDCQDILIRLDLMVRAEALARTQDLGCHVLTVLTGVSP